jgi:hypothetical protein
MWNNPAQPETPDARPWATRAGWPLENEQPDTSTEDDLEPEAFDDELDDDSTSDRCDLDDGMDDDSLDEDEDLDDDL